MIFEDRTNTDPTDSELRATIDGLFVATLTLSSVFTEAAWQALRGTGRLGWFKAAVCVTAAAVCMDRAAWAADFRTRYEDQG